MFTMNVIVLTHWGRVMHICIGNLIIIVSDNGLLPGRCQAIIGTNAVTLLIETLRTNFSEFLIKIQIFSFQKMHFKMLSAKWHPFCLSLECVNPILFLIIITHRGITQCLVTWNLLTQRFWSTLIQLMLVTGSVPSQYLIQCYQMDP